MPEERRLRVYTELRVLEVLSRRSERLANRVLSEFRSTKQEPGRGTGPCVFSRRDPVKEQIKILDYLIS